MEPLSSFDVITSPGVRVVRPRIPQLTRAVAEQLVELALEGPVSERVILDLRNVELVASSVIAMLPRLAVARRLRLIRVQPAVAGVLRWLGLDGAIGSLARATTTAEGLQRA